MLYNIKKKFDEINTLNPIYIELDNYVFELLDKVLSTRDLDNYMGLEFEKDFNGDRMPYKCRIEFNPHKFPGAKEEQYKARLTLIFINTLAEVPDNNTARLSIDIRYDKVGRTITYFNRISDIEYTYEIKDDDASPQWIFPDRNNFRCFKLFKCNDDDKSFLTDKQFLTHLKGAINPTINTILISYDYKGKYLAMANNFCSLEED